MRGAQAWRGGGSHIMGGEEESERLKSAIVVRARGNQKINKYNNTYAREEPSSKLQVRNEK